jgi:hypothetical protein
MMRWLPLLFLAGCAVTQEQAARMSDYRICEAAGDPYLTEESRRIAATEARHRGVDCRHYEAQIQRDWDRAYDQLERAARPQPSSTPTTTRCQTIRNSDSTYTTFCR